MIIQILCDSKAFCEHVLNDIPPVATTSTSTSTSTSTTTTTEATTTTAGGTTTTGPSTTTATLGPQEIHTPPPPTPAPTTKEPEPEYPFPIENKFNIHYANTASHYWHFDSTNKKIVDDVKPENFLFTQLQYRANCLKNVGECPTDVPQKDCCPKNKAEICCPPIDRLPESVKTDVSTYRKKFPDIDLPTDIKLAEGLDETDYPSFIFNEPDPELEDNKQAALKDCLQLGKVSDMAQDYEAKCIATPENCDYGLSFSVWVNFTDSSFGSKKEYIFATGTENSQGFFFYYEVGYLHVEVIGETRKWKASRKLIKEVDGWSGSRPWRLIGFIWKKTSGYITIYIETNTVDFANALTSDPPSGKPPGTTLNLGCSIDDDGNRVGMLRMRAAHPALWMWPVKNDIFFTGALVYKIIRNQPVITTPMITTTQKPLFDYSEYIVKLNKPNEPVNPYVLVADEHFVATEDKSIQGLQFVALNEERGTSALKITANVTKPVASMTFCSAASCPDGFSLSVWARMPAGDYSGGIVLEGHGFFRIHVLNAVVHVYWSNGTNWRDFYTYYHTDRLTFDSWVNIAFTVTKTGTLAIYLNGYPTQLHDEGHPMPAVEQGGTAGDLFVGSSHITGEGRTASVSLDGASVQDVIVWHRYLFPFEVNRLIGYTSSQYKALTTTDKYWTTDIYMNRDASLIAKYESERVRYGKYSINSLYRHVDSLTKDAFGTELDQFSKSNALHLKPVKLGWVFLGHQWKDIPNYQDISWKDKCLTDPEQQTCQSAGMSVSLCLKIKSVSAFKSQFFLNSGDMGVARSIQDSRGISFFTNLKLLGVSISTKKEDWSIIIDSNRYEIDKWFCFGFTWHIQHGIRMFINGVDNGIRNNYPDIKYKFQDHHKRVVAGRFDIDKNETWTTSTVWEMSDFVLGDIKVVDKYLTPAEYSDVMSLQPNKYYEEADYYWYKEGIIDNSYRELQTARKYNLTLGPKGEVNWDGTNKYAEVKNGAISLAALPGDECPGSLSTCAAGFTLSVWMKVAKTSQPAKILTLGTPGTDSEYLQLEHNDLSQLKLTLQARNKTYSISYKTTKVLIFDKWINIGIVYSAAAAGSVDIYQNGVLFDRTDSPTAGYFVTSTDPAILTLGDVNNHPTSSISLKHIALWKNKVMSGIQLSIMLGMKTSHMSLFSKSNDYWVFSGLLRDLVGDSMTLANVEYVKDRFDDENTAVCTNGLKGSYVDIRSVEGSCLYNIHNCTAIMMTLVFKLESMQEGVILSSGAHQADHQGFLITQKKDKIEFVVKEEKRKCVASMDLNSTDWSTVLMIWNAKSDLVFYLDGVFKDSSKPGLSSNCSEGYNFPNKTFTNIMFGRSQDDNDPQSLKMCISDMMTRYQGVDSNEDLNKAAKSLSAKTCYTDMDFMSACSHGCLTDDHLGDAMAADAMNDDKFTIKLNNDSNSAYNFGANCLGIPGNCPKGFTMSVWAKITAVKAGAYLLKQQSGAFAIYVSPESDTKIGIRCVVASGSQQWQISTFIKKNDWVNIGVTWNSQEGLRFFIDGKASAFSNYAAVVSSAIATGFTMDAGHNLQGAVANLVEWATVVASCSESTEKNTKKLTGSCNSITTTTAASDCASGLQAALQCKSEWIGGICGDNDIENILVTSRYVEKITNLVDANTIMNLTARVMKDNDVNDTFLHAVGQLLLAIGDHVVLDSDMEEEEAQQKVGGLLQTMSDLMDNKFKKYYKGDHPVVNMATYMQAAEPLSLKLASSLKQTCKQVLIKSSKIAMSAMKVTKACSANLGSSINMPRYDSNNKWEEIDWKGGNRIAVGEGLIEQLTAKYNDLAIASVSYKNIDELLKAANQSSEAQQSDKANGTALDDLVFNSEVTSFSFGAGNSAQTDSITALPEKVNITLKLRKKNKRQKYENNIASMVRTKPKNDGAYPYEAKCSFMDLPKKKWDVTGCQKVDENETHIVCECDHLTNFAVLMQEVPMDLPTIHDTVLSVLSYLGLILSCCCLIFFLLILLFNKKLVGDRYIIHINLCFALFFAQVSFLLIDAARDNRDFCRAIGICMHFFFLSTFCWLLVEALFVFYAITAGVIHGRLKCYIPFAWGMPAVIVAACAGIDISSYGADARCWLSYENYFIWAFLGPVMLLIIISLFVCGIVACNIGTPAIKRKDIVLELKSHMKQTAVLIPFMLFAWMFGMLLITSFSIPIAYLFVIFNSSQGIWVFIFFGYMNPDVKAILCRGNKKSNKIADSTPSLQGVENLHGSPGSQAPAYVSSTPPVYHGKGGSPLEGRSIMSGRSDRSTRDLLDEQNEVDDAVDVENSPIAKPKIPSSAKSTRLVSPAKNLDDDAMPSSSSPEPLVNKSDDE